MPSAVALGTVLGLAVAGCGLVEPSIDARLVDGCDVGGANRLVRWFSLERALDYPRELPNLRPWHSLQASQQPALVAVFEPPYRTDDGAVHETRTICAVLFESDGSWDRASGQLLITGVTDAEIAP
jgi:hypothetical protein